MADDSQKAEESLPIHEFIEEITQQGIKGMQMDFEDSAESLTPELILDEINKIRQAPAEYALENFEDDEEIDEDLMDQLSQDIQVPKLSMNKSLILAAEDHCKDMAETGIQSHTGSD